MSGLRREHMGERGPTDVLSFPALAHPGEPSNALGDLVLCIPVVRAQAGALPFEDEFLRLAIHGLVHILGHDHRHNSEARRMHALERRALRAMQVADVPRPYVARLSRATSTRRGPR